MLVVFVVFCILLPVTQSKILAVVHQKTSTPGHLGHLLQHQGYSLDLRCPALDQPLPASLQSYRGVVVFGGPMSANDDASLPFIRTELEWIQQVLAAGTPFLGICLGAQLLARVLGAQVRPHAQGRVEVGYWPLAVRSQRGGATPLMGLERVFQWHNEGFELPQGAQHLAATPEFPNQAFAYGSQVYGFQFHPEMTLAMVKFWNQEGGAMLARPGAQPTAAQLRDYYRYQGQIHHWLDGFLASWLGAAVQSCGGLSEVGADRASSWDAAR